MSKTAFLFSGQGAQYPGMMPELTEGHPAAEDLLVRAGARLGMDIPELVRNGPAETLNRTEYTQPVVLACELAALSLLRDAGLQPEYIAGFSLGEWAALVAGGVLSFEDGVDVVSRRAAYMQQAVPLGEGAMAVILGKAAEEVEALCAECGDVYPSNYNCPGQISVAGRTAGIDRLLAAAGERGIVAKKLAISVPSHCVLMQPAADRLEQDLAAVPFGDASAPIVMNCTGLPERDGAAIKANMIRQLTQPVRFEASVRYMLDQGVDTFVEIGPGKTLAGLVKKTAKAAGASPVILTTDGKLETTLNTLCGG